MKALLAAILWSSTSFADSRFQILAPAEESFIGMDQVLIIGKVLGPSDAKMVEISNNGKTMGFVPLKNANFNFKTSLSDRRH